MENIEEISNKTESKMLLTPKASENPVTGNSNLNNLARTKQTGQGTSGQSQ
jgi:hypothetical protein